MNYFVAEYKDGITYGHCKGMDELTAGQALIALQEKYPTALRVVLFNDERIMEHHVAAFWEGRAVKGGLSK